MGLQQTAGAGTSYTCNCARTASKWDDEWEEVHWLHQRHRRTAAGGHKRRPAAAARVPPCGYHDGGVPLVETRSGHACLGHVLRQPLVPRVVGCQRDEAIVANQYCN